MAKNSGRAGIGSDAKELAAAVKTVFDEILAKLDPAKPPADSRFFKSGIELIKFTIKAGSNIDFTIVVAGKDAPKLEALAATSDDVLLAPTTT